MYEMSLIAVAGGARRPPALRGFVEKGALLAAPRLMQFIQAFPFRIIREFGAATADGVFFGQRPEPAIGVIGFCSSKRLSYIIDPGDGRGSMPSFVVHEHWATAAISIFVRRWMAF
jgi:hypothetical protein